ncbi:MAG: FtsX-like permease family protein [Verrucomicrobiales bacterium]|nr:FtsX-like permease family protein [Verrucomicrobiales bacterium]
MAVGSPMTFWKLVFKSLTHYRWVNLAVLTGVALTSAILSGALVVGDSVKESLRQNAEARISNIGKVVVGGDRFFTAKLAENLVLENADVAPVLQVRGTVSADGGNKRANAVQIVGVDESFWKIGIDDDFSIEDENWFAVNDILANRLDLKIGDALNSRVEIPGELSKDAPLSGESEQTKPFNETITHILGPETMGRYSLKAEQVPPGTVFLPIEKLQTILEKSGQANLLLVRDGGNLRIDSLTEAIEGAWTLEDAQLEMTRLETGKNLRHLTSPRVFLEPEIVEKAKAAIGDEAKTDRILTYLANAIRFKDELTPYSMITGATPNLNSIVPPDLKDDEIVISDWLAEDLGAKPGDEIELEYFVVESGRKLVDTFAKFKVHSVAPLNENGWDQSWTPEFPGIFEVDDLNKWEPGIPINKDWIKQHDEDYWDDYRATPKAFITLAAAEKLFGNRFGKSTSLRFSAENPTPSEFEAALKEQVTLADLGLSIRDVRAEAQAAVAQSFDFGQLFAYMSFFLILAALILAALVFVFGIESRTHQIGLLLAVGMPAAKARRIFLAEAAILSVIGALIGLAGGYVYTTLALRGMSGAWADAAAGIEFVYHLKPISLAVAFAITVVLALITVWLASRAVMKIQPGHLISGSSAVDGTGSATPIIKTKAFWIGIVSLLGGLGCLVAPKAAGSMAEQGMFFGAGFLFTIVGVCASALLLRRFEQPGETLQSLASLGRQNSVRRKGRSLAVIGLMAAGVFMVTAINSFRLEGERGALRRDSGTGGFAYVGESTLPVYEDLNDPDKRKKYGLDSFSDTEFRIVQFRVSDGEDASCLNLNRSQRPRLMGVDPGFLSEIGAFSFAKSLAESDAQAGWRALSETEPVPGIIDLNTATYALQEKMGEEIEYETGEGDAFSVQLFAMLNTSIVQGSIIIHEDAFIEKFPDSGGYRFFLLDCADPDKATEIAEVMTRMFGDRGLEMRPAAVRLNEFNAVQNTYLSIFSTLGGLGILLGTIGLGIVVGRNVMERRGQLGLMQAVGFTRHRLGKMVLSEHWFLHAAGVVLGIVAAVIAVAPKIFSRSSDLPLGLLVGMNAAILFGGLIFCWLAARSVLRGKLMDALRSE